MSGIKQLAGQTLWYGLSSIAARLINYLLTPYLTYTAAVQTSDFGKMALVYAAIPLLNIIFTYGLETAYFRFSAGRNHQHIYSTAALSIFFSTLLFSGLLWAGQNQFARAIGLEEYPDIIRLSILIIALDTLSTLPFARLRQENRPIKFAAARILGIVVNVFLTWFFISYCPAQPSGSWTAGFYDASRNPIYYVVLANLIQSVITLLFLTREIAQIRFQFDTRLWKEMMIYALPLVIAGLGGMINETFDRLMLRWWLPGSEAFRESQVGIYNACYKLSILITLFIQAFRMGAEPFFFRQAQSAQAQAVYARVMKLFVIVISLMFLVVSLFMPVWKHFIGPRYWEGLGVVPILLMANIFLGIYYNLSVWYKLSNRTMAGAWITLAGALVTLIINFLFIPSAGYLACAWATCICYGAMMVLSYVWGQRVYRIPYAWKKLLAYLVIVVLLFFLHRGITWLWNNTLFSLVTGAVLTAAYAALVSRIERKEFAKLPVLGRFFRTGAA